MSSTVKDTVPVQSTRRKFANSEITFKKLQVENFKPNTTTLRKENIYFSLSFEAGTSIGFSSKWRADLVLNPFVPTPGDSPPSYSVACGDAGEVDKDKDYKVGVNVFLDTDKIRKGEQGENFFAKVDVKIENWEDSLSKSIFYSSEVAECQNICVPNITTMKRLTSDPGFLRDGTLSIYVTLTLYKEQTNEPEVKMISWESALVNNLQSDFNSLLIHNTRRSEFEHNVELIPRDGRAVCAHKFILKAPSPVFATLFRYTGNDVTEVDLKDFSRGSVVFMRQFIYTGEVRPTYLENSDTAREIIHLADKYRLSMLKKYCDANLITWCTHENALKLLSYTDLYRLKGAKKQIGNYVKANFDKIMGL